MKNFPKDKDPVLAESDTLCPDKVLVMYDGGGDDFTAIQNETTFDNTAKASSTTIISKWMKKYTALFFNDIQVPAIMLMVDFVLFDNIRGALQVFFKTRP